MLMRKIIVLSMISLDGVMQAPGGPEEDRSGGFQYGGWVAPLGDEVYGEVVKKEMAPTDLLLGRMTYDIFASYWPSHEEGWPGIASVNKYVYTNTITTPSWENTTLLKSVDDIVRLKESKGTNLHVYGSSQLVQLLLGNDLVDELWLKIHPITLGNGKRLFADGAIPAAFTLTEHTVTTTGVIIARYRRAGDVKTGSFE